MNVDLQKDLTKRVNALRSIPSAPVILQPLLDLLRQPPDAVDVKRVVELVSYDGSIAAQCLRIANSPLYGRARATESVQAAVLSLGIQRIEDILLSCCLNQLVPSDKWATDPAVFWRHSLGCALVSRELAQRIQYPDPEKAYLASLLHDLGILVNSLLCTEEYRHVFEAAAQTGMALHEAERDQLGFTHCESGKILAETWQISAPIVEVIEFHHHIELAPAGNSLVALVHLSDLLCRLRGLGYGYNEWRGVDLTADPAWDILAVSCPRLATMDVARFTMDLDAVVEKVTELVDAVFAPAAKKVH